MKDADFIIHLAAIVGYPACKAKPDLAYDVNYIGTKNIVEKSKVPIIFPSTGSIYGQIENICNEESDINPLTEYGKTKTKAEDVLLQHSDFVIYRFSTGFGISPRPRLDLLVNDFLIHAMKDKELIVFEKDYWRSFIHVKDMSNSLIFALENFDRMNGEIYNIGCENLCLTKEDVALKIKEYIDYNLKFAEFDTDPDKRNYKVCFKKIKSLGFNINCSLDDGIKEMMNAFESMKIRDDYYNYKVFK